jgi:hypothetical protein
MAPRLNSKHDMWCGENALKKAFSDYIVLLV